MSNFELGKRSSLSQTVIFKVKARKWWIWKKICCYLQIKKLDKDIAVTQKYWNRVVKSEAWGEKRHISLGKVRFNIKISISSYKLSHAESPVKTSPATSKANTGYLKRNIFQFHIHSVPGQGGTAGQAFQTLTNFFKNSAVILSENTSASYSNQETVTCMHLLSAGPAYCAKEAEEHAPAKPTFPAEATHCTQEDVWYSSWAMWGSGTKFQHQGLVKMGHKELSTYASHQLSLYLRKILNHICFLTWKRY